MNQLYICMYVHIHTHTYISSCVIFLPIEVTAEHSLCCTWVFIQFSSVAQSCPTLCDPMDCSTPGLPGHHQLPEFTQTHVHLFCQPLDYSLPGSYGRGISQGGTLGWAATSFSGDLPNPGTEPRSPALQVDSLPSEPCTAK